MFVTALTLTALCSLFGCCSTSVTTQMSNFARFYFQNHPGLLAYFCQIDDALDATKWAKNAVPFIKARQISNTKELFQDSFSAFGQGQRIGLFLDVRCSQGSSLLTLQPANCKSCNSVADMMLCTTTESSRESAQLFNASYSWMLWTDNPNGTLSLLRSSRLSVDSRLAFIITNNYSIQLQDVYRVHVDGHFVVTDISDPAGNFRLPSKNNFGGYQLKTGTLLYELNFKGRKDEHLVLNSNYKPYTAGIRRYSYVILTILSDFYNFDFDVNLTETWHSVLPNGTPTGFLADLTRGKYDLLIAPSYYVSERLDIVSLPAVLGSVRYFFVFRQPISIGSPTALISPISPQAWLSLFGTCLICLVVLYYLLAKDPAVKSVYKWSESFIIVGGAIAQRSVTEMGSQHSTRIGLISILLMALISNFMYNTSVLNGLLVKAPDAIQNIDQLLLSNLKITCNNVSYLKKQLVEKDAVSQKFKEKISTSDKAYVKLEKGVELVQTGDYALYVLADDFYRAAETTFSPEEFCSTSELTKERSLPWGYTAVKNSPYKEHIRRGILLVRESGISQRLLRLFRSQKLECTESQMTNPFSLKTLSLAFALLLGGVLSSAIVFTVEWLVHRRLLLETRDKSLEPPDNLRTEVERDVNVV